MNKTEFYTKNMQLMRATQKMTFLIFLLITLQQSTNAQSIDWIKHIGGGEDDLATDMAMDDAGNLYITGNFEGTADFDPQLTNYNISSKGGSDIFLSKMNAEGQIMWIKQIKSDTTDQYEELDNESNSITVDDEGNIYLTGSFEGTVDFDPGEDTSFLTSNDDKADMFICKFEPNGSLVWVKQFGGELADEGTSIALNTSNDMIYATGNIITPVDFGEGEVINNDVNMALLKLDSSGNLIGYNTWGNDAGLVLYDSNNSVTTDNFGNVFVTGTLTDTFDPELFTDAFVSKFNSNCELVWTKQFIGDIMNDGGVSLVADGFGNVYITGFFFENIAFNLGSEIVELTTTGFSTFVTKLDNSGNVIWAKHFESDNDGVIAAGINIDGNNNIFLTGILQYGTADFDPGPDTALFTSKGGDVFITKLDSAGNLKWVNQPTNSEIFYFNSGIDIEIGDNGDLYVVGVFEEALNFKSSAEDNFLTPFGGHDIFLLKISQTATAIKNSLFDSSITLYPNPTSNNINVKLGKVYPELKISVIDVLGQEVMNEEYSNVSNVLLTLDGFDTGMYLIQISDRNNHKAAFQILKE